VLLVPGRNQHKQPLRRVVPRRDHGRRLSPGRVRRVQA
jgi:hypothetical protein